MIGCGRFVDDIPCCAVVKMKAEELIARAPSDAVVVSDPPFNIGYHYDTDKDRRRDDEYMELLASTMRLPSVLIHYPESIFRFAARMGEFPTKTVAWVYNANTPRQWRMISWFGVKPDFTKGGQPYKNQNDRRVRKLIAEGRRARLYDWWDVQQVKNVSKDKTAHPCQMPLEVMDRVVTVTPCSLIVDPFAGAGTTLLAAKRGGAHFIGCDISQAYVDIANKRLEVPNGQSSR